MHLVVAPLTIDAADPMHGVVPDLPAWLRARPGGWGQAGRAAFGRMLVWADVDGAEADALSALDLEVHAIGARAELVRLRDAMRVRSPLADEIRLSALALRGLKADARGIATPTHPKRLRAQDARRWHYELCDRAAAATTAECAEWVSAYRSIAAGLEPPPSPLIVGLTLAGSDGFSGSNGANINGRTMDGANAHVWAVDGSTWAIQTARARPGGSGAWMYDATMSAVDEQKSYIVLRATSDITGCTTRHQSGTAGSFYGVDNGFGGAPRIFKMVATSPTQISAGSGSAGSGDTLALYSTGSSHTGYVNGSVSNGPVTDTTHTTGRCGVWSYFGSSDVDDFMGEVAAAAAARPASSMLLGVS